MERIYHTVFSYLPLERCLGFISSLGAIMSKAVMNIHVPVFM
jgi:hypothetical protein